MLVPQGKSRGQEGVSSSWSQYCPIGHVSYCTGYWFSQITRSGGPADAGYKVGWPEVSWVCPSTPVLNQLLLVGRAEVVDGVAVCGSALLLE